MQNGHYVLRKTLLFSFQRHFVLLKVHFVFCNDHCLLHKTLLFSFQCHFMLRKTSLFSFQRHSVMRQTLQFSFQRNCELRIVDFCFDITITYPENQLYFLFKVLLRCKQRMPKYKMLHGGPIACVFLLLLTWGQPVARFRQRRPGPAELVDLFTFEFLLFTFHYNFPTPIPAKNTWGICKEGVFLSTRTIRLLASINVYKRL